VAQFVFVGRRHNNHTRHHSQIGQIEHTVVCRAVFTHYTAAIDGEYDWEHIENDRTNGFTLDSSGFVDFLEVAMQFNVSVDYANLSSVQIYNGYIPDIETEDDPTGEIKILNGTWTGSAWEVNQNDVLATRSLPAESFWKSYSFSNDVTLRGDWSYFILLNDTTIRSLPNPAYWKWGGQTDPSANDGNNDSEDEGVLYFKTTHGGSWSDNVFGKYYDLNLRIESKEVELSGSEYVDFEYTNPSELDMLYNTSVDETFLSTFTWFNWNGTSDNTHRFVTSRSVSFDVDWIVNLTYTNNPISNWPLVSLQSAEHI